MDLIADIGATNTRCALLDDKGRVVAPEVFRNADFTGVDGLLTVYLDHRRASDHPKRAALAVAAPIVSDQVAMVNIDWAFSQDGLKARFKLSRLLVVNDFAAIAWSLPYLSAAALTQVGRGEPTTRAPMVTLGPGSGLGVASIVPSPDGWTVAAGDGGHATMPAATDEEAAVISLIRASSGHCSAERVLSGPGLMNLYAALGQLAGQDLRAASAAEVVTAAERGQPLAMKALEMFFAMLGTVAGNLALTLGARGGVYVAGGIVPRLLEPLARSGFRGCFEAKGRYRPYMERVPTYVITEPLPAFQGLRRLLGYR